MSQHINTQHVPQWYKTWKSQRAAAFKYWQDKTPQAIFLWGYHFELFDKQYPHCRSIGSYEAIKKCAPFLHSPTFLLPFSYSIHLFLILPQLFQNSQHHIYSNQVGQKKMEVVSICNRPIRFCNRIPSPNFWNFYCILKITMHNTLMDNMARTSRNNT